MRADEVAHKRVNEVRPEWAVGDWHCSCGAWGNLGWQGFAFHLSGDVIPALSGVPEGAASGLDAAYRERNAVVAALFRTNGWPVYRIEAPDAPGWFIVYAETPQGQVSWHVGPDDIDLFDPPVGGATWDGHDTEEKYRRVAALRSVPSPEEER